MSLSYRDYDQYPVHLIIIITDYLDDDDNNNDGDYY